jgi:UDP-2,3-diacylglucosamine hydrolase
MSTLLISDLHLDDCRPEATQCFLNFLTTEATQADRLYILGDLFEACTGNDPLDDLQIRVAAALATLNKHSTRCFFMHGNRDFLISTELLNKSGLTLLHDPTLIYVAGESVLLSHGDIFCTDDEGYQRYRRIVRNPVVRKIYDMLPFSLRNRIVNGLRAKSQVANEHKSSDIMDVNAAAIAAALGRFQPATLLHGHTHRPGIHTLDVNGQQYRRIVLGDWYKEGSVLRWDASGPELATLKFPD